MTKVEKKMHSIRETIDRGSGYCTAEHEVIKYEKGEVGYYIADAKYFCIKYKGFEVNINGVITYPNLNEVFGFNLNSWLNEVKKIMRGGKV